MNRTTGGMVWALVFAFLCAACGAGSRPGASTGRRARSGPPASRSTSVRTFSFTVDDLERVSRFFAEALDAELGPIEESAGVLGAPGAGPRRVLRARLGDELLELVDYAEPGDPTPADSRANDLWFEHVAIVVSDIDEAHRRVIAAGAAPISEGGVQTIPPRNEAAAGIRAFYFADPEGHPLELIWFPAGKGDPRWQSRDRLVLGVDHSAITVSSTGASREFYEALGFERAGGSFNEGPEQEALSGVPGARVEISGLRSSAGPGVELLRYAAPTDGRAPPLDQAVNDLWHWEIVVTARAPDAIVAQARGAGWLWAGGGSGPWLLRDPDGHFVRLEPL